MHLLRTFLSHLIVDGSLGVIDARGIEHRFGTNPANGAEVVIRLTDPALYRKLALRPGLCVGEAYMDGTLQMARGSIWDFLDLAGRNLARVGQANRAAPRFWVKLAQAFSQCNSRRRARANVAHHYDLSHALYATFLDRSWQYSCAYYPRAGIPLEAAQEAKMRHIAAKLLLQPGQKVLDIGCGWGRLAMMLSHRHGVDVTGITLSKEQLAAAKASAEAERLAGVHFLLKDYRELKGTFDRIVSVGMFEHVGAPFYPTFFRKLADLLAPKGVALLHTIGSCSGPGVGNPWISKYIFPGGYIPSLSEILPAIERSGLIVTDVEVLRLHYADTLRAWRERFLAHWDEIKDHYDDRFRRMWEFYLAGSEMAFRHGGIEVFQIQLAKDQAAVPLTRDYIAAYEASVPLPALQAA